MLTSIGSTQAQDPIELPSWELGWDENMDGTHTLSVNDDNDIVDTLYIFIDNTRNSDLNIELDIEWDSSEEIPIEIDFPSSITIGSTTNETISISLLNENGYVFERSPNSTMTLSVTANEIAFDQSVSSQEIDGKLAVPSVYELIPSATSRGEKLYSGSWVEYDFKIDNNGNSNDAIDNPQYKIRSCPQLDLEGMDELDGQVIAVGQMYEMKLKIKASEAHPDRTCEITLSITSSGNNIISSITFDIAVSAVEDNSGDSTEITDNSDSELDDTNSDLTESSSLTYVSFFEFSLISCFAMIIFSRNNR
jgi:hypothetical protein